MHSQKIIHRDLKPENVFIDDFYYPKIADFGLSKIISNSCSQKHIGTPIYMAPEILYKYEYSEFSDAYAFAMLAYELITNQKLSYKNIINVHQMIVEKYRPEFIIFCQIYS